VNFLNFIPRGGLPRRTEGSSQVPWRDPNSPANLWHSVNDANHRAQAMTDSVGQIQRQVARMRNPTFAGSAMHPFKIYQLPRDVAGQPYPNGVGWRTVIVRGGRVMETDALFTDNINDFTDYDVWPNTHQYWNQFYTNEIPVPDGIMEFWFWLEIGSDDTGTTASVRWGDDTTASSYNDPDFPDLKWLNWTSDNPWAGFNDGLNAPIPDATHVPIGTVDTKTSRLNLTPIIRQYLRSDLVFSGGGGATWL
jgi:hypothetical protein